MHRLGPCDADEASFPGAARLALADVGHFRWPLATSHADPHCMEIGAIATSDLKFVCSKEPHPPTDKCPVISQPLEAWLTDPNEPLVHRPASESEDVTAYAALFALQSKAARLFHNETITMAFFQMLVCAHARRRGGAADVPMGRGLPGVS